MLLCRDSDGAISHSQAEILCQGGFSVDSFSRMGLSPTLIIPLVEAANQSLAASTWRSNATAEENVKRVEKFSGVRMTLPFTLRATIAYVSFLLVPKAAGRREVQGKSIEKYLSAIRILQM